jgi:hypothetical protein
MENREVSHLSCMVKRIFVLGISSLFLFACSKYDSQSRTVKVATKRYRTKRILVLGADYEESRVTVIYFWTNHHFSVDVNLFKDGIMQYYSGTYSVFNDTVHLNYYKDIKPSGRSNYMLSDPNDKFSLFYPSTDGSDTVKFNLKKSWTVL